MPAYMSRTPLALVCMLIVLGTFATDAHAALLDEYPGAYAAYSLRQLSDSYDGSVIRVRRSSDNAEQDIGFNAEGWLDTDALSVFVGTGPSDTGYVTAWYDQTGGEAMMNNDTIRQPYVVHEGKIITDENDNPSLYFVDADDRPEGVSTYLSTPDRSVTLSSIDYTFSLVVQRAGGEGEQAYAGIDKRGRPHEGVWYRGYQTYINGGSARAGGPSGLVEELHLPVTVRNSGTVGQLWQGNTLLSSPTSADDPDLATEQLLDQVHVGGSSDATHGFTGFLSEFVVYDSYGGESWPTDYYTDAAQVWGAGPTSWNDEALLSQIYDYQVTLYDWLETVGVEDVTLPNGTFTWDDTLSDIDELSELWVHAESITTSRVVRAEPEWYVLDAGNGKGIEATGEVRIWHEPGSGYGGNPARSWANEPAYLYQLSIPGPGGTEGNPYYQHPAMGKRALVVAMVDMLMYHERMNQGGYGKWQDMYGKAFVSWAQTYAWAKDILPPDVQAAYEEGMGYFLDTMIELGPRAVNTNMDMFSMRGAAELYMAADDAEIKSKCLQAVKRALFGYTDGVLGTKHDVFKLAGIDKGVFDPSGFIMEGDQPDVFYGGESIYQLTGALAAVTDRNTGEVESAWQFLEEVVRRLSEWRHYQYFFDLGVASPGTGGINARNVYHAGAGFSGRTGASVPAGQAGEFYKFITLADHFDDQKHLARVSARFDVYTENRMRNDIEGVLDERNTEIQETYVGVPPTWNGWSPWTKEMPYLPQYGWYSRLKSLVDANDPSTFPLVARQSTYYNKPLGGPPTGYEYWAYKNTDGEREWGFFMEAQARQGSYGGWYGGKIETFWTDTTGVVLLNRHGKTGCDAGDSEDSMCWDNMDYRAAHHVWGKDEHGGHFSTLHLRGQSLDRPVAFDTEASVPSVSVTNKFNNSAHTETPESSITGEETGHELDGDVSITNKVEAYDDGAQVTHTITSDGTDEITELWASLPIFLRLYSPGNPGDQPQVNLDDTTIEYWNGSAYVAMPEDTNSDGIPEIVETQKLRLGRDYQLGDGIQYAYVVFNETERVRLSTQIYYDPYQTKTSVRTVHIDLHGDPGTAISIPESRETSYRIKTNDNSNAFSSLQSDFNADSTVNIFDYNLLLTHFGATADCGNPADANGDCTVNIFDYNVLLGEFGMSG